MARTDAGAVKVADFLRVGGDLLWGGDRSVLARYRTELDLKCPDLDLGSFDVRGLAAVEDGTVVAVRRSYVESGFYTFTFYADSGRFKVWQTRDLVEWSEAGEITIETPNYPGQVFTNKVVWGQDTMFYQVVAAEE